MACKVKYTNKECADMHYITGEAGTKSNGAEPLRDKWFLTLRTSLKTTIVQPYVTHKPRYIAVPIFNS
jgi:hypothetical protein